MTIRLLLRLPLFPAALAFAACMSPQSSGQTGGQVGDSSCHVSARAAERGDKTPLGFSAADVLEWVEGTRTAPLDWKADTAEGAASAITIAPAQGMSSIELIIEYTDGPIQLVERKTEGGAEGFADLGCSDTLEIEVRVSVTTGNGALRDVFRGQLVITQPQHTELSLAFELSELEGDFAVASSDVALQPADFRLVAQLAEDAFSGRIESVLETMRTQEDDESDIPPEQREDARDTPTGGLWIVYGRFDSSSD